MRSNQDEQMFEDMSYYFRNLFKAKPPVKVGDIGIFRNVFTFDTLNDDNHAVKYDVYIKVKALGIYDKLVEVEVIDTYTVNTCTIDIKALIESTMPKYLYPNSVKWEVK